MFLPKKAIFNVTGSCGGGDGGCGSGGDDGGDDGCGSGGDDDCGDQFLNGPEGSGLFSWTYMWSKQAKRY